MFNNLNPELQNILIYNYQSSTKFFIILMLFVLSYLYLFYIREGFDITLNPYIALLRVLCWVCSWVFLYATPLMYIFYLTPDFGIETLLYLVLSLYSIMFVLVTIYFIINFAIILPISLLRIGLLNPEKFKNTLFKNLRLDKLKIKTK